MWHMWFMGNSMAVSGLVAGKGKPAVSQPLGGGKVRRWLQLRMVSSLSVHNFYSRSLSSRSFWLPMFCPCLSSVPSFHLYFCLPRLLSTVFHWAVRECGSVWVYGELCSCSHCRSSSFLCFRFNPFLTLHFHMLRQQSSLVAFCNDFIFHSKVRLASSDEDSLPLVLDSCESTFGFYCRFKNP